MGKRIKLYKGRDQELRGVVYSVRIIDQKPIIDQLANRLNEVVMWMGGDPDSDLGRHLYGRTNSVRGPDKSRAALWSLSF